MHSAKSSLRNAAFWMYGIWDLGTYAFPTYGLPSDEAGFFADWGWIASPAVSGSASSLTHPIIYAAAADAADPNSPSGSSAASAADLNTDHAVTTTHIGIKPEQLEDPRYAKPGRSPGRRASEDHSSSCPTTRSSAISTASSSPPCRAWRRAACPPRRPPTSSSTRRPLRSRM